MRILVVVFMVEGEVGRSSKSSQSIIGLGIRLKRNSSDHYPCWPWIIVYERLPTQFSPWSLTMTMKLSSEMNEQPPSGWLNMWNSGELMGVEGVRS